MKKRFWQVYVVTCSRNGKRYVGITSWTMRRRFMQHISAADDERFAHRPLHRAIKLYGRDAFTSEWVASCLTAKDACATESLMVEHYNSRSPNGYNLTGGGEGLTDLCAESRASIGAKNRQHLLGRPRTAAQKAAISKTLTGKPKTQEHKDAIRRARTGVPRPDVSAKAKGRIISPEQRAAISATLTGRPGTPWSPQRRAEHEAKKLGLQMVLEGIAA